MNFKLKSHLAVLPISASSYSTELSLVSLLISELLPGRLCFTDGVLGVFSCQEGKYSAFPQVSNWCFESM